MSTELYGCVYRFSFKPLICCSQMLHHYVTLGITVASRCVNKSLTTVFVYVLHRDRLIRVFWSENRLTHILVRLKNVQLPKMRISCLKGNPPTSDCREYVQTATFLTLDYRETFWLTSSCLSSQYFSPIL